MRVRIESLTSVFPGQSNDIVVENVEGEALSEVLLEVRLEEVVSTSEEIPSMVKLNAMQLGEFVFLVFGIESVADSGRPEDGNHSNDTSHDLVVLAGDGGQDGRVENGHEIGKTEGAE